MTTIEQKTRTELRDLLSANMRDSSTIQLICKDAGLELERLNLSSTPEVFWDKAIDEAVLQMKLQRSVDLP